MSNGACLWHGCCAAAKVKGYCKRHYGKLYSATSSGYTRLTDQQRAEIVKRLRRFEKPRDLAIEYGVSIDTIHGCSKAVKR